MKKHLRSFFFLLPFFFICDHSIAQERIIENLYVILLPKTSDSLIEVNTINKLETLLKHSSELPTFSPNSGKIRVIRYGDNKSLSTIRSKDSAGTLYEYFEPNSEIPYQNSLNSYLRRIFNHGYSKGDYQYFDSKLLSLSIAITQDLNTPSFRHLFFIRIIPPQKSVPIGRLSEKLTHFSNFFEEKYFFKSSDETIQVSEIRLKAKPSLRLDSLSDKANQKYLYSLELPSVFLSYGCSMETIDTAYLSYANSNKLLGVGLLVKDKTISKIDYEYIDPIIFRNDSLKITATLVPSSLSFSLDKDIFYKVKLVLTAETKVALNTLLITNKSIPFTVKLKKITDKHPSYLILVTIGFFILLLFLLINWLKKRKTEIKKTSNEKIKVSSPKREEIPEKDLRRERFVSEERITLKSNMRIDLDRLSDNFEQTEYGGENFTGKIKHEYYTFEPKEDKLIVLGTLTAENTGWSFLKENISLVIEDLETPDGFQVELGNEEDPLNKFSEGNPMPVELKKSEPYPFKIVIYRTDFTKTLENIIQLSFSLRTISSKEKFRVSKRTNYFFGPDLGSAWIGFDPGTTGSCLAYGSSSNEIHLHKENGKEIIPSIITIPKQQKRRTSTETHSSTFEYLTGFDAERYQDSNDYQTFESIKKLLGFKDNFVINYGSEENTYDGKSLSSLLIKGIHSRFAESVKNTEFQNTQRCVMAIPNNFTGTKIQQLLDSVKTIPGFKDIRFLYESEAVAFYYLRNYKNFQKNPNAIPTNENILLFDMGGATINVSLLNIKFSEGIYQVDVLGKLGYGIGGDTIDYCFIKELSNAIDNITNPFIDKKETQIWWKFARDVKHTIIKNYPVKNNYISKLEFDTIVINSKLNPQIKKAFLDNSFDKKFTKEDNEELIRSSHELEKLVYRNVKKITRDILKMLPESTNTQGLPNTIDTLIFSGRSTYFPNIRAKVLEIIRSFQKTEFLNIEFNIDEAKTAVAFGACWYGISKGKIKRSDMKTGSSFGVRYMKSGDINDIGYLNLIQPNKYFDKNKKAIKKEESFRHDFSADNNIVSFYQVMGSPPEEVIKDLGNKHQYNLIGKIKAKMNVKEVDVTVHENDKVEYGIKLVNEIYIKGEGIVNELEIGVENDAHYTFMFNK